MDKTSIHVLDRVALYGNSTEIPEFNEWSEEPHNIRKAERLLRKSNPVLRRGDLMYINAWDYRNDGILIYDGNHFIDLDFNIDDYGALPEQFTVREFPINYWQINQGNLNGISHNGIIWIPNDMIHKPFYEFSENNEVIFYFTEFTSREKTILLCLIPYDSDDLPDVVPFDYFEDAPSQFTEQYGELNVYIAVGDGFIAY